MRILISCFLSRFSRLFFPAHLFSRSSDPWFVGKMSPKSKIKVTLQSKFSVLMCGFSISETQEILISTGRKLLCVNGNFSKLIIPWSSKLCCQHVPMRCTDIRNEGRENWGWDQTWRFIPKCILFAGKGVWGSQCASSLETGRDRQVSSDRQVSPHSSRCVSESHN